MSLCTIVGENGTAAHAVPRKPFSAALRMMTSLLRAPALVALVLVYSLPALAGETLTPPAKLRLHGIPDIPGELAAKTARYTEPAPLSFQGWHPFKREMLVITRAGNAPQLHRLNAPGGAL